MNEMKTIDINGQPYLPTSYLLLQLSTPDDSIGLDLIHQVFDVQIWPFVKRINIMDIPVPEWRVPYEQSGILPLALPFTLAIQAGIIAAKEALDNRKVAHLKQDLPEIKPALQNEATLQLGVELLALGVPKETLVTAMKNVTAREESRQALLGLFS
jgi:hypothetical protein